jgi:transposase
MNSLFLNSPKRVEALVYLLLIVLMILTIAEKVVRNKLKENDDIVFGMNNRKLKQPTLKEILRIINRVRIISYTYDGKVHRKIKRLDDSCEKQLKPLI